MISAPHTEYFNTQGCEAMCSRVSAAVDSCPKPSNLLRARLATAHHSYYCNTCLCSASCISHGGRAQTVVSLLVYAVVSAQEAAVVPMAGKTHALTLKVRGRSSASPDKLPQRKIYIIYMECIAALTQFEAAPIANL